jgi:hypothetical protein
LEETTRVDERDRLIKDCIAALEECHADYKEAGADLAALASLMADMFDGTAAEFARLGSSALAEAVRATTGAFREALGIAAPATAADLAATLDEIGGWLRHRSGGEA